jgi:hypothetical protein
MCGGSLLEAAEEAFDNLQAALAGLVGQRILNSIDESLMSVNMDGMTLEQRKALKESIKNLLTESKQRAEDAIKNNRPVTQRFFHVIPTSGDKQITALSNFSGASGSQAYSVEDVLFHAKALSGTLGIDLSMLGFADLLSGGMGDGGFFRTSAQAAERSRVIRISLAQFFDDLVDLHTYAKYGWVFDQKDRPYKINFYGSISALENEKMASRERAANATGMLVQTLAQMKDVGLDEKTNKVILSKQMMMDDELAEQIAKSLAHAREEQKKEMAAQAGGGFGGGGDDNPPPKDYDVGQNGADSGDDVAEEQ